MIGKDLLHELKEDDVNGNLENIISDYCWDNLYTDIMELIKIEFHKWCEQNPSSPYLFTFLPVDNAHELANREDDIGDKILVNQKIDYDTRDKAWIDLNGKIYMPDLKLCTDNGAMIACAGYYNYINGKTSDLALNAIPNLKL